MPLFIYEQQNHMCIIYHVLVIVMIANNLYNTNILDWINSFLTSRTQRVILDGATSDKIQVTSGVPQGSVLGPILFLHYINDLPTETHSHIRLFADDAILYREIKSNTDCTILQEDLNRLANWETKWLMKFNPSKCQILSVLAKNVQSNFHINSTTRLWKTSNQLNILESLSHLI